MVWKPGQSGNPAGKQIGAKDNFTRKFWTDLNEAWQKKGIDALERVIEKKPETFVTMAASLLPKEEKHEHSGTLVVETWRDRLLNSHMNRDLGSEASTTEPSASPSVSATDAAAKPTLQ